MSERVILAVKFTPAGTAGQVRKAVGGFLRYVQHRDLHPAQPDGRPRPEVSGLLKYVAYRDRASTRAELFGPSGTLTSEDRKAFAVFVANALEKSGPQLFRGRNGELRDRRRAVYRFVISPERASGLDLRRLTNAAVSGLEEASGVTGLRWIAAIHRNTNHHHVHLVLAGMRADEAGGYHRVDITKARLAAVKEALGQEIQRQRSQRMHSQGTLALPATPAEATDVSPAIRMAAPRAALVLPLPLRPFARFRPGSGRTHAARNRGSRHAGSILALRAVARRYSKQMQREVEREARLRGRERAA